MWRCDELFGYHVLMKWRHDQVQMKEVSSHTVHLKIWRQCTCGSFLYLDLKIFSLMMVPRMKVKLMYFQQGEGKEGEDWYSTTFCFIVRFMIIWYQWRRDLQSKTTINLNDSYFIIVESFEWFMVEWEHLSCEAKWWVGFILEGELWFLYLWRSWVFW